MRLIQFLEDKHYQLEGVAYRAELFRDEEDYARFLFLILYFQSPLAIRNVTFYARSYLRTGRYSLGPEKVADVIKKRQLALVAFALSPTSYSLVVRNIEKHSVSAYMQRVLMAYGKYYNAKYGLKGHVFRQPYHATELKSRLSLTKAVEHCHSKEMAFSSFSDYDSNRWGELLKPQAFVAKAAAK